MSGPEPLQALQAELSGKLQLYAALDGAADPELVPRLLDSGCKSRCLFHGRLTGTLLQAAPHLALLDPARPFTHWLLSEGWGRNLGVFLSSSKPLPQVWRHLRKFLISRGPDGRELYFRFYDPRVFGVVLPLADAGQLDTLYGKVVERYAFEEEGGAALRVFAREDGAPTERRVEVSAAERSPGAAMVVEIVEGASQLAGQ